MDSSVLQAILEALTKLVNPKLEKELETERLKRDYEALQTMLALGCKIDSIEYCDGRLKFKANLTEVITVQNEPLIQLEDASQASEYLLGSDNSKLQLEEKSKKYE